jgi:hypothetical protein
MPQNPPITPEPRTFVLRCSSPGEGPGPVRIEAASMLAAALNYAEHWPQCGLVGVEVLDPATGERSCFTLDVG